MSLPSISGKIQVIKSKAIDEFGVAVKPLDTELDFGEIAVNYSESDPCIFFKDNAGKIIKIVNEEIIADTLVDILGGSAADLSTLKELLAAYSSSDVVTTQVDILNRLGAVESGKVDKVPGKGLSTNDYTTAEKNKLSGIATGAQVNTVTSVAGKTGPVTLTNTDVGLGNVVNKEQLGKNETASGASKVVYSDGFTNANDNPNGASGFYLKDATTGSSNWANTSGTGLTIMRNGGGTSTSTLKLQLFSDTTTGTDLMFRRGWGTANGMAHTDWFKMWHSGNSNISSENWTANSLYAHGGKTYAAMVTTSGTVNQALFGFTDKALGSIGSFIRIGENVLKFQAVAGGVEKDIYHAGNSNNFDAVWDAKMLKTKTDNPYGITIERTGAVGAALNNSIRFITPTYTKYLGFNPSGIPMCGDGGGFNAATDTIWYAGNSNKADVNWTAYRMRARLYQALSSNDNSNGEALDLVAGEGNGTDKVGGGLYIIGGKGTGKGSGGSIYFRTSPAGATSNAVANNSADRMVITGSGNVGIGTVTPQTNLHIQGSHANCILRIANNTNTTSLFSNVTDGTFNIWNHSNTGINFATNDTTKMFISKDGNVGIGITTPTDKLEVVGGARFRRTIQGTGVALTLQNDSWVANMTTALDFKNGSEKTVPTSRIDDIMLSSGSSGGNLRFFTQPKGSANPNQLGLLERMRINHDGDIGIGTTSPAAKLDVAGSFKSHTIDIVAPAAGGVILNGLVPELADGGNAIYYLGKERTSKNGGSIAFSYKSTEHNDNYLSLGIHSQGDILKVFASGNVGVGVPNTDNAKEKLDIRGNGLFSGNVTAKGDVVAYSATSNVRIEPAAGASALFDLTDVELPADLTNANNFVLAYDVTKKKWTAKESAGTGGAPVDYARLSNVPTTFTPTPHRHDAATYVSDVRLKQNIEPLNKALEIVLALDGKQFGWTTEAYDKYKFTEKISYGYIAQEVEKVLPQIVKKLDSSDGYIGVEYIKMIPIFNEAIKALHNNIIDINKGIKARERVMNRSISDYTTSIRLLNEEVAALKGEIELLKQSQTQK